MSNPYQEDLYTEIDELIYQYLENEVDSFLKDSVDYALYQTQAHIGSSDYDIYVHEAGETLKELLGK
jgi:hypothetical protein|tara:strand:- start:3624 stop:3824 length:201 start_codon:yes stop_codon:yes gene_type:complete